VTDPAAVSYVPIGVVRSPYGRLDGMPLQTAAAPEVDATVELEPRVHGALRDLDGFSHLWLVVHLHRVTGWQPEVVPFLDDERPRGVLATRSPRRPNPIGLSLARIVAVDDLAVVIAGVDLLAGTPVLDLKPYVPLFDAPSEADVKAGWFEGRAERVFERRSDDRFLPRSRR
jgi:tRNA-Thr(GGU) m(6)t(6)A37 methyltransferase TsaA